MKNAPNRVLVDFSNASGFFEGDPEAWEISRKMSKNQIRKLRRRGIVPRHFFEYLATTDVIKQTDIPNKPMTIGDLLKGLRFYRYASEGARSMGEYLYREIIKGEIPWLAKSFGQGDYVWEKLEES
jgi:hypothetical protein